MSKSKHSQISEFDLSGRFLGFIVSDGYKLKHIRLATPEGEQIIKLAKSLRASIKETLTSGDWLRVRGEKQQNSHREEIKLKAYELSKISNFSPESANNLVAINEVKQAKPTQAFNDPVTVLVCQKSDCARRGGNKVCQALMQNLTEQGLAGAVKVKGTGCMKQCKAGPHVVVMPDKSRYSHVRIEEVPAIVEAISEKLSPPQVA